MVKIELIYVAKDKTTVHLKIELARGATVEDAIKQSCIYDAHPEISGLKIGIFAKPVTMNTVLQEGDRIEFYRPLAIDPKDKRRQLARLKK